MSRPGATVVWPHRASPLRPSLGPSPVLAPPVRHAVPTGTRQVRLVMAGGGTGGHLYPGLAVAAALQERLGSRLSILWAATPRPVDKHLLAGFGEAYIPQPVQPMPRRISKIWPFIRGWRESCKYWQQVFSQAQADAVLALGGYAAGPAAHVAARFGIPVALLNPDALPGLANRFLLKRAQCVFVQWPLPAKCAGRVRGRVLPLGCPIRNDLLGRTRVEAAARLGLDPARPTLVITGASLGAKTINDALLVLLDDPEFRTAVAGGHPGQGAAPWQLLHLAGAEQAAAVGARYAGAAGVAYKVLDYCDDMASVWALADLAIARAGASTCAELTACGVPALLLPYPYHRDQHQRYNAAQLEQAGAAIIVDDLKEAAANAIAIKTRLLPLLYDTPLRQRMAQQARAAGKPDAAGTIADELLTMIR